MKYSIILASGAIFVGASAMAQENGLNDGHLSALDADGNAAISFEEFNAFADFAFQKIDLNQDGSLSRSEVEAHADGAAFDRADTDGNGTVSEAEFKARMKANFDAADKDGDGQWN